MGVGVFGDRGYRDGEGEYEDGGEGGGGDGDVVGSMTMGEGDMRMREGKIGKGMMGMMRKGNM